MIVFETEEPGTTDTVVAEFANEKLKGCVTVNDALASGLGVYPLLKALDLTTALFVKLIAPL